LTRSSLGTWRHLARRFMEAMSAARLRPAEMTEVRSWLRASEQEMFFAQPRIDQRHGYQSARLVMAGAPDRIDLIRAALLHDLGKRRAGLGPIRRSLASIWAKLGGMPRGSWANYLGHGEIGAIDLESVGAEAIVVQWARSHHGPRPDSISEADWRILQAADQV
jgi:hypothetical protein